MLSNTEAHRFLSYEWIPLYIWTIFYKYVNCCCCDKLRSFTTYTRYYYATVWMLLLSNLLQNRRTEFGEQSLDDTHFASIFSRRMRLCPGEDCPGQDCPGEHCPGQDCVLVKIVLDKIVSGWRLSWTKWLSHRTRSAKGAPVRYRKANWISNLTALSTASFYSHFLVDRIGKSRDQLPWTYFNWIIPVLMPTSTLQRWQCHILYTIINQVRKKNNKHNIYKKKHNCIQEHIGQTALKFTFISE